MYKQTTLHKMTVTVIRILTMGGQTLWIEDDALDIVTDILTPNGIHIQGTPIPCDDHTYLCPVDTTTTTISDFYKWEEIPSEDKDTFCWRTFYAFGEKEAYDSWLPIPSHEHLGPYSCQRVLDMIHETRA